MRDPGDECDGECCQPSESSRVAGSQVDRNVPVASMEGDLSDDGQWPTLEPWSANLDDMLLRRL